MCGIIFGANFKENKSDVNEFVKDQLSDQIGRGKEGFGIAFVDEEGQVTTERATELTKVWFDLHTNKSRMIMLHHRAPTSSENKISQTHPILVNDGSLKFKYLLIHNGVMHNEDEIREKHVNQLGFVYTTDRVNSKGNDEFNDSESLAIEVARFIEKQTDKIESIGSVAFVCMQIDKKTNKLKQIFFYRNTSPLNLSMSRNKIRISSEGEGEEIKQDTLYSFTPKDFKLKKRKCEILSSKPYTPTYGNANWDKPSAYCGYSNTMWKKDTESKYLESSPPIEYLCESDEIINDILDEAADDIASLMEQIKDSYSWDLDEEKYNNDYIDTILEQIRDSIKEKLPKFKEAVLKESIKDYAKISDKEADIKEPSQTKPAGCQIVAKLD